MTHTTNIVRHDAATTPHQILDVARAYHFPTFKATGRGFTAGIIELGGGYMLSQLDSWLSRQANVTSVTIGHGSNSSDGPNGADGEVQSDIEVFCSIAPDADVLVIFADQSDDSFLAALEYAFEHCDGVTLSWGSSENTWDPATMVKFEAAIKAAKAKNIPFFVAAGDTGADDSSGDGKQVDFPASSPSAIGCGGTRLTLNPDGSRASETTWNDSSTTSATGGGVSKQFPGRQVPDIAGNADPDTGYQVSIDGEAQVIGGTSLVAPLMLGLYALLWELHGAFDIMSVITSGKTVCYDVTIGSNGGYRAGVGRDEVTGFGVPDGTLMDAALTQVPVPAPTIPPVPTPDAWAALVVELRALISELQKLFGHSTSITDHAGAVADHLAAGAK